MRRRPKSRTEESNRPRRLDNYVKGKLFFYLQLHSNPGYFLSGPLENIFILWHYLIFHYFELQIRTLFFLDNRVRPYPISSHNTIHKREVPNEPIELLQMKEMEKQINGLEKQIIKERREKEMIRSKFIHIRDSEFRSKFEEESRKNVKLNEQLEELKVEKLNQEQEIIDSLSNEIASKSQRIEKQKYVFKKLIKGLCQRNKVLASEIERLKDRNSQRDDKVKDILKRAKIQIMKNELERENLSDENRKLNNILTGNDVKLRNSNDN